MQHVITPHSPILPPYVWWEGGFSSEELDWLQNKAKDASVSGKVGGGNTDADIRRSKVTWLENSLENQWVFERLGNIASNLNAQHYRFDLTGFGEGLQLSNYDQSDHGMYGWHQDFGGRISRKLSMALQLTDPSEYEGGNFEVLTGMKPHVVPKQRGFVTVFPSYAVHQVTPVTRGSRQSLVAWVSGPPFK